MLKKFFSKKNNENENIENLENEEEDISEKDNENEEEDISEKDNKNEVEIINEDDENKKSNKGFFKKLQQGLSKTRKGLLGKVDQILVSYGKVDEELLEEIEEILITSDIGMQTTMKIVDKLREKIKLDKITDPQKVKEALKSILKEILNNSDDDNIIVKDKPIVMLVIGVNGAGKTTSIGKIAHKYKSEGKSVLLAAGDTFRAAAIDQLKIWSERVGINLIKHQEGSDPAAVIYDAVQSAKAKNIDLLICDTAGRLHNKKNLMVELEKVMRVVEREFVYAQKEVLLVLDATTGQNAVQQAKVFKEITDISGIILTKLDGTAKGGVILSVTDELNIPVRFIGVGEGIDDLQQFNSNDFVEALFN